VINNKCKLDGDGDGAPPETNPNSSMFNCKTNARSSFWLEDVLERERKKKREKVGQRKRVRE